MLTLYNVVSQDGFIAREDGDEDFIPDDLWTDFIDLCKKNDAVIMGRKTYEAIQKYPEDLLRDFEALNIKRAIVTRGTGLKANEKYLVVNSPEEAAALGQNILLSSGPNLNQAFLEKNLVDRIILNILPEKIGSGIKVFSNPPALSLISEENFADGRKRRVYKTAK